MQLEEEAAALMAGMGLVVPVVVELYNLDDAMSFRLSLNCESMDDQKVK